MNWLCKAIESVVRAEAAGLIAGGLSGSDTSVLKRRVGTGVLPPKGMHQHDTPEICIALSGPAAMHVDARVFAFSPPAVAILPPGVMHAEGFKNAGTGYALLWLHGCSDSSLIGVVSEYRARSGWQCVQRLGLKSKVVRDLLRKISDGAGAGKFEFEGIRADLLSILAAINRHQKPTPPRDDNVRDSPADHAKLLRRVQEFLDHNYTRPIDVSSVAMLARFSPNYLNGLFSQWKGQGIREYLIARRMEHAMRLCRRGGFLVKEVSRQMGYSDPFYFSRAFHRFHGCWPTKAGPGDR